MNRSPNAKSIPQHTQELIRKALRKQLGKKVKAIELNWPIVDIHHSVRNAASNDLPARWHERTSTRR